MAGRSPSPALLHLDSTAAINKHHTRISEETTLLLRLNVLLKRGTNHFLLMVFCGEVSIVMLLAVPTKCQ